MRDVSKSLDIVARDERFIAPSSRSPYYPFAVASGSGSSPSRPAPARLCATPTATNI